MNRDVKKEVWQKANDALIAAIHEQKQFWEHIDCSRGRGKSLTALEQDVADLFLAQVMRKRVNVLKLEGDWPEPWPGQPSDIVQALFESIQTSRSNPFPISNRDT